MIQLLLKTFIKNHEKINDSKVRAAYGLFGSMIGIFINLLLCFSKIGVGYLFSNVSILADGINNLSDAGSSVVALVGFKLASKPADEDHPYGHERIEYLAGLVISFIILLLGIELMKSSLDKILHPEPILFSLLMVIVLIFSIVMKLWLMKVNTQLGKRIHSSVMLATAADSRNDVLATSTVLIALLISYFTGLQLDGYIGVGVGLFIFISGINLIKETSSPLLGQAPDPELVEAVEQKLLNHPSVLGFHDLVLHSYGPNRYFASVHVEVPADANLLACHDLMDLLEKDFEQTMEINMVVHLDPIVTNDPETQQLKKQVEALIKQIHPKLTLHDFRKVVGTTHSNLVFDVAVPVGYKSSAKDLAAKIDAKVKTIDPTYYTLITIDTNYVSTSISSQITN